MGQILWWWVKRCIVTTSQPKGFEVMVDIQDTKKRVRRSISMSNFDFIQGKEIAHSRYMNFSQLVRDLIRAEALREERQHASEKRSGA
jgi:hypothetical protein